MCTEPISRCCTRPPDQAFTPVCPRFTPPEGHGPQADSSGYAAPAQSRASPAAVARPPPEVPQPEAPQSHRHGPAPSTGPCPSHRRADRPGRRSARSPKARGTPGRTARRPRGTQTAEHPHTTHQPLDLASATLRALRVVPPADGPVRLKRMRAILAPVVIEWHPHTSQVPASFDAATIPPTVSEHKGTRRPVDWRVPRAHAACLRPTPTPSSPPALVGVPARDIRRRGAAHSVIRARLPPRVSQKQRRAALLPWLRGVGGAWGCAPLARRPEDPSLPAVAAPKPSRHRPVGWAGAPRPPRPTAGPGPYSGSHGQRSPPSSPPARASTPPCA